MDVKIDAEAMQSVVAKALMEGISTEQRDLIMEQAVKALITPPKNSYGRVDGQTPLQDAFDMAATSAVRTLAREAIEKHPEFRERVDAMLGEAITNALQGSEYDLRIKVQEAVIQAVLDFRSGV